MALFASTGIITVFTNFEGFPENWQGNVPAIGSFFTNINAPASWSMRNTLTRPPMRSRKR